MPYLHIFFFTFASLFSITNPIGVSAVFLAMTQHETVLKQKHIAKKVGLYSLILLIATFFIGPYVLLFFGISLSSVQVAGGMLVFYTAWSMFGAQPKISHEEKKEAFDKAEDCAFFPLTMPLTAGAGAMAAVIAIASNLKKEHQFNFYSISSVLLAIIIVCLIVWLCYRYAGRIVSLLGQTGSNVITRLTAFILLAIAVTTIWDGFSGWLQPFFENLFHTLMLTYPHH